MFNRLVKPPKNQSFFLFGPRQTGKTWLLRNEFQPEQTLYYNLLLSEEYMRLNANPVLFREEVLNRNSQVTHIIVDEVQRVPALLNEIHNILESANPPHFALTGSSARKLKRSRANMLGGRAWTLQLHPLTHLELQDSFQLSRALALGTLPKICTEGDAEAAQILRSYVETYLKEEIEAEALVRATGSFIRFLFQAGHESGNVINFSNIARDVGTSSVTVKQYFQILEDTLIGRFLPAYSKSTRKRLAAHPKFYLFDCGVQRALLKRLTVPLMPQTDEYGTAFEHFIINECWSLNSSKQLDYEFSVFRTENGVEVDLIIETPSGDVFAVEIKSSQNPVAVDFRTGLESFASICPSAKLFCVCNAPRSRKVDNITILPWLEFFKSVF
jgi:predicted AAA+ superfamily ATPase